MQPNLTKCLVAVLSPNKNGERGREVIFVKKHHVHHLQDLNCELICNEVWRAELNCELNIHVDEILMVELNRESNFDVLSVLKN